MTLELIGKNLPALLGAIMLAILFIQSGLDKVFDWKGNLDWLNGHFSKTFLRGMVSPMLATLTVMEVAVGVLSAVGVIYFLVAASLVVVFYAAVLASLTLLSLFFGQRIAKDYPGAVSIVPYFILTLILIYLTNPYGRV